MPSFTDSTGTTIHLTTAPRRIVSLVPSQTELLHALGLEEEVVGITRFCVHPTEWFRNKTRIGGTKDVQVQKLLSLQPNLVIANKEENIREQVEAIRQQVPVYTTDVNGLKDALEMIAVIGEITGRSAQARQINDTIREGFRRLEPIPGGPRTAYLIWKDPYMAAGGDTFIHDMLQRCGLTNIYASAQRYPVTSVGELKELDTRLLLLSSEPYPFREKHIRELQEALPDTRILLVDGEYFSWYGSRLIGAADYFRQFSLKFHS